VTLGTAISRAVWNDDAKSCIVLHTEWGRIGILSTLMSDLVLLVLMLFGLLRWKTLGEDVMGSGGTYAHRWSFMSNTFHLSHG